MMRVQFHRTSERQYHVVVLREGMTTLAMKPAPGFDTRMPHDLQHFVVEKALKLNQRIFGQLAAGGTARTLHAVEATSGKDAARARRQLRRKGDYLSRDGAANAAISERATFVFWSRWLLTQSDPACVARGQSMQATTAQFLAGIRAAETKRF